MIELEGLGIKLNHRMQEINAKVISNPTLELGKKKTVDKGKEAFFNLFDRPIFHAKHPVDMGIIYFKGVDLKYMVDTFTKTSTNLCV
jgi:hypothetical protein